MSEGRNLLSWCRDHGDRESADLLGWHFETVCHLWPISGKDEWHVSMLTGGDDDWVIITGHHSTADEAKAEAQEWVCREIAAAIHVTPKGLMEAFLARFDPTPSAPESAPASGNSVEPAVNRAFLELSRVATAKTQREAALAEKCDRRGKLLADIFNHEDTTLSPEHHRSVSNELLGLAQGHDLYKTGDKDAPAVIRDNNGEIVLGLCRRCGRGEADLVEPCAQRSKPAGQPTK